MHIWIQINWGITTRTQVSRANLTFWRRKLPKDIKEVLIAGHIVSKAQDRILPTRLMDHIHCPRGRGPVGVSHGIRNCPRIFFGVKPLDMSIGAEPKIALMIPGVQTGE
jgi:hypothetical protein